MFGLCCLSFEVTLVFHVLGLGQSFSDVHRKGRHAVESIGHGAVEVVVAGAVVEEVVDGECPSEGSAETLYGREFPEGVGRVVDGFCPFRDVVVVDELHVLHVREEATIEREAKAVTSGPLLVPVDAGGEGVLAGWDVLAVDGVAVCVLGQLLVGVGV